MNMKLVCIFVFIEWRGDKIKKMSVKQNARGFVLDVDAMIPPFKILIFQLESLRFYFST